MAEEIHLGPEESLRMSAVGFAIQIMPYTRQEGGDGLIGLAAEIYQFLKTGEVPEKKGEVDAEL